MIKKRIPSLLNNLLVSILVSLAIIPCVMKYLEIRQINDSINLMDSVIYTPQLELEKSYNNNQEKNKKNLDEVTVKYPEIRSIYYINNGVFSYGSNNNEIGLPIPDYMKKAIDDNLRSQLLTNQNITNEVNYLFKFGTGYYVINFYLDLLRNSFNSEFSNFYINNLGGDIDKVNFIYGTKYYSEHLNLVVDSGFVFERLISLYFIILGFVFCSVILISSKINIFFDSKRLFLRKIKKAVINKEFIPYYQSVYSIKDNAFLSAEVLCRWDR